MSFNIAAGQGDLTRTGDVIAAENADIVALQEVDVHWHVRSGFADQARALAERLGMQSRFAHIYSLNPATPGAPRREYGVAILSRFPIVGFTNHPLTRLSTVQAGATPTPMPGFLEVQVDVAGSSIRVFDTHLDYRADPAVRHQQVAEMLAILGDASTPAVLMGDLNAAPDAAELRALLSRLRDSAPGSSAAGMTYPATAPTKRIDYVLHSDHFRVRSVRVVDTNASDHRPVVVDLVMQD